MTTNADIANTNDSVTWSTREFDDNTETPVQEKYERLWGTWGAWEATTKAAHGVYASLTNRDSGAWLPVQLLGDTKLRADEKLLASFGATGISGLQGAKEQLAVLKATNLRREWTGQTETLEDLGRHHAETSRGGAILSEAGWSTLCNDAFMLAGIHQQKDFVFVGEIPNPKYKPGSEEPREIGFADFLSGGQKTKGQGLYREAWDLCNSGAYSNMEEAMPAVEWKRFFLKYPRILWTPSSEESEGEESVGIPRVFLRELLGLKCFGYKPHFRKHCLFFSSGDADAAKGATFDRYLEFLAGAEGGRFDHGKGPKAAYLAEDKKRIVDTALAFLFGD